MGRCSALVQWTSTSNWLGLVSRKPFPEDYVPVLPWLGVLWWGLAAASAGRCTLARLRRLPVGLTLSLATLGRWSLSYYMVHQPVMIGLLMAVVWVMGRT